MGCGSPGGAKPASGADFGNNTGSVPSGRLHPSAAAGAKVCLLISRLMVGAFTVAVKFRGEGLNCCAGNLWKPAARS
jgi:hypothetical protein